MQTNYPPPSHARPRPTYGVSLHDVTRAKILGELDQQDTAVLKTYALVVEEKTATHERMLRTNLAAEVAASIRADLRLFARLKDEITGLLTRRFHEQ